MMMVLLLCQIWARFSKGPLYQNLAISLEVAQVNEFLHLVSIYKAAHNRFSCLSIAWALSLWGQPLAQRCCCSPNPPCLAMGLAWPWPVPTPREVPGSRAGAVSVPPSWLGLPLCLPAGCPWLHLGTAWQQLWGFGKAPGQPGGLIGKICPGLWALCLGQCQGQDQGYFSLMVTAKAFCEMSRTTAVTQYSETWEKYRKVKGTTVQWACTVVLFILQMLQALKSQIIFPRVVCVWLPEQGGRSLFMSRWHQQEASNALISPDTTVGDCAPFKPLFWGNVVTDRRFYLFSVLMRQGFGHAQLGMEPSSLQNCLLFCRITFNPNIWKFTVSSCCCWNYLSDDNDSVSPFWATADSWFWWIWSSLLQLSYFACRRNAE